MKIRNTGRRDQIVLQMTPMIDIVFQLLVFFVFTFKIVLPEGDFNIRMPASAGETSLPTETPLLKVRLRADGEGQLASVLLGDLAFTGQAPFAQLQEHIRGMIDDAAGPTVPEQEVEIDADYSLRYNYVMNAMTAITGYVDETGNQHKLIERVRFAPLDK